MNFGKLLGTIATAAAPVAAGYFVGPEVGAVVAATLGAGAGAKKAGKKIEERTGVRVQKVAAPVVAVASGAAFSTILPPETIEKVCDILTGICHNPLLLATLPGLLAVLAHQLGINGLGKLKK